MTAVGDGSGSITATAETALGAATITVTGDDPDLAILAAFYHATGGAEWTRIDGWLTDMPRRTHGTEFGPLRTAGSVPFR